MESGQTKTPSFLVGLKLAHVLGVTPAYLATGRDAPPETGSPLPGSLAGFWRERLATQISALDRAREIHWKPGGAPVLVEKLQNDLGRLVHATVVANASATRLALSDAAWDAPRSVRPLSKVSRPASYNLEAREHRLRRSFGSQKGNFTDAAIYG